MSNQETVQQIYEAFGRGDIAAILERMAEASVGSIIRPATPPRTATPLH